MLCEISIRADGSVEWERRSCEGHQADAACTAEMVLAILGADTGARPTVAAGRCHCSISFKGIVGRMLASRGMRVTLNTYSDQHFFEVYSDIDIANPASPERGTVRVADDASVTWRCRLRSGPDDDGALEPAQIAGAIAQAITERQCPDSGLAGGGEFTHR